MTSKDFHVSVINRSINEEILEEDESSYSKKTIHNLETKQSVAESPITNMQIN